jgi:hypothetical protein
MGVNMPTIECSNCGTPFHKPPSYFAKHANPCCSQACKTDLHRKLPKNVTARKLTPQTLHDIMTYDPETGLLTWKPRPLRANLERLDKGWNKRFANKPAGTKGKHGHLYVTIDYKHIASHRLAWALHYGEWPEQAIDHINGKPDDNRIINLRLATQTENLRNAKIRKDNTSGHKGVYFSKRGKKWCAYINYGGKLKMLGRYETKEEAINRRRLEAELIFGEFARETV